MQVRVADSLVHRRDQKEMFQPPLQAAVSNSQAAMPTLAFRLGQDSYVGQASLGQALQHRESPAPADGSFFMPAALPSLLSLPTAPLSERSWTSESSSEAGHFQVMIPYRTPRRPPSVPPLLIPGSSLALLKLASQEALASRDASRSTKSGYSTDVGSSMSTAKSLQVSKPCPPTAAIAGDCCSAGHVEDGRAYPEQFPLDEVAPMLDAEALRRVKDYLKSQSNLSSECYLQEKSQAASDVRKRAGFGGA